MPLAEWSTCQFLSQFPYHYLSMHRGTFVLEKLTKKILQQYSSGMTTGQSYCILLIGKCFEKNLSTFHFFPWCWSQFLPEFRHLYFIPYGTEIEICHSILQQSALRSTFSICLGWHDRNKIAAYCENFQWNVSFTSNWTCQV